jgi:hypothetical protein
VSIDLSRLTVDELLNELKIRHWGVYVFGSRSAPSVFGAVLAWSPPPLPPGLTIKEYGPGEPFGGEYWDVIVLRGAEDATSYRVPRMLTTGDPFTVDRVVWQYHSCAAWSMRAVLALHPPGHPDSPIRLERAGQGCGVLPGLHRPQTFRPGRQ